jgi:hypothetical protein
MCPHTYYYICVLRIFGYFTLFFVGSLLNIGDRACASLTLAGIEKETDVCVCARVCVCVCVCACVYMSSLSVCFSLRLLCLWHLACMYSLSVCLSQAALSVASCMYSLSVCLSQAALCAPSTSFSKVPSIYLSSSCYISSSYLYSHRGLIPQHMRRETTLLSRCLTVMIFCI